jgi:hypothetical protein
MKAVLFLAFLVFAAQAQTPIHELYQGFINNLPLESNLKQSLYSQGMECLNSAVGLIADYLPRIQRDVQSKQFFDILKVIVFAEDAFEHKIAPQCVGAYQQLAQVLAQNSRQPNIDFYEYQNVLLFQATVQQELARAFETVLSNRFYEAGAKLAHTVAIAAGMVNVELPKIAQFGTYTPYNEEKFIREYIAGAMGELGANGLQINQVTRCVQGLVNSTKAAFSNPALHYGDRLSAVHAFLEGALMVTDSFHLCQEVDFTPIAQFAQLFKMYPIQMIVKIALNGYTNRVAIMENAFNISPHTHNGEYFLAGKDFAKQIKAQLKDIVY